MSPPLLGPEWIKKDLETHAEAYPKFIATVENARNSTDEGIKQVITLRVPFNSVLHIFLDLVVSLMSPLS
jgi:hypothetical protein